MTARRPTEPVAVDWVAATPACPCRCCGAPDGCSARVEADYARCLASVSERPMLGGGWLHSLPAAP